MPAPRRTARRTGRRTARRTSRRTARRVGAAESAYYEEPATYEPEPQPAAAPPPEPAESVPADDPDAAMIQRLRDLSELHEQGALTDEQYEEAKNRIIDAGT